MQFVLFNEEVHFYVNIDYLVMSSTPICIHLLIMKLTSTQTLFR